MSVLYIFDDVVQSSPAQREDLIDIAIITRERVRIWPIVIRCNCLCRASSLTKSFLFWVALRSCRLKILQSVHHADDPPQPIQNTTKINPQTLSWNLYRAVRCPLPGIPCRGLSRNQPSVLISIRILYSDAIGLKLRLSIELCAVSTHQQTYSWLRLFTSMSQLFEFVLNSICHS
jgi:hypothetical protein